VGIALGFHTVSAHAICSISRFDSLLYANCTVGSAKQYTACVIVGVAGASTGVCALRYCLVLVLCVTLATPQYDAGLLMCFLAPVDASAQLDGSSQEGQTCVSCNPATGAARNDCLTALVTVKPLAVTCRVWLARLRASPEPASHQTVSYPFDPCKGPERCPKPFYVPCFDNHRRLTASYPSGVLGAFVVHCFSQPDHRQPEQPCLDSRTPRWRACAKQWVGVSSA
jgi:hypothetical protein